MNRDFRKAVTFLFCLGLCFLVVNGSGMTAEVKRGGTLTVGIDEGPVGWDPHIDVAQASWNHYEQIYESLLQYNYKMEVEPCLATSWEQIDPVTLVFHLRKGVKFHNGREMTADDVKYSFERMQNPKTSSYPVYTEAIKSIEVLDKYTVRFKMSVPDADFLSFVARGKGVSYCIKRSGRKKW